MAMRYDRRSFLQVAAGAAGTCLFGSCGDSGGYRDGDGPSAVARPQQPANPRVAIARCRTYDVEKVKESFKRCFDLLGGVKSVVNRKTVTVKINLTGRPFRYLFGKPPGETYLTHGNTAHALASIFLENGARRVRFVDSTNYREDMREVLSMVEWDVDSLLALGNVELEDTRNLGSGSQYTHLTVPDGGRLFSSFDVNHCYADTDVFVSLSKMKNHSVAGVTLSMKNLIGVAPNSLYGADAGSEDAVKGRNGFHGMVRRNGKTLWPGEKEGDFPRNGGYRIPRIIVDLCAARPIDIAIIDGVTAMRGGEGWWSYGLHATEPGVLIAGFDPVATDAVGTAVMGYEDPRARKGIDPFLDGDNHLVLADEAGLGTADLSRIKVCGVPIEEAVYPYHPRPSTG